MKYTIKSLNDQQINAKDYGQISFNVLFKNERNGAMSDSNTTFEFDDTIPSEITLIQEDANGKKFPIKFSLPNGVTYQNVLDIIKPYFEKTNQ
jgi:hypothetical protein